MSKQLQQQVKEKEDNKEATLDSCFYARSFPTRVHSLIEGKSFKSAINLSINIKFFFIIVHLFDLSS